MAGEAQTLDQGTRVFFDKADLTPPQRIPRLATPPVPDFLFQTSLHSNGDEARSLLTQQRISEPGYTPPERQLRHKWSTTRLKENSWTFTKHEVAKAFDSLLSREPLAPPGVAQAVLNHASVTSLDELWCHFLDSKLEKGIFNRLRRSRLSVVSDTTWLDGVTRRDNVDYIRLMCHAGLGKEVLNRAFSIALFNHSMEAMEALLSYGAVASACKDAIRERFRLDDVALARLLLSAPNAMSVEDWKFCIDLQVVNAPTVLILCLAHHPGVASGPMLLKALELGNMEATAIMLANSGFNEDFRKVREEACRLACLIKDNLDRRKALAMLAESGWVTDTAYVRQELMKDVNLRDFALVRTLTDAGVSLDVEPNNVLSWAVSHMDLDILKLFENGRFSSPVSYALKFVPDSTSEQDMLQLLTIFRDRLRMPVEPLHSLLVHATQSQHSQLVHKLVDCGASLEFQQASAVRIAIEKADFGILTILLRGKCSPEILSTTISTAMALKSRSSRLQAIRSLVEKGVLPHALGNPLQSLVSEGGEVDFELIQLLLQYRAPVDGLGNDHNNSVLIATRRGNLFLLKMLCNAGPKMETLSKAVPLAFRMLDDCSYNVGLGAITLLLNKGAAGVPIHYTLVTAASQDYRLDIVRVLVEHGADTNHSDGASFAVALKTKNLTLLEILCAGCPPNQATIESVLSIAIDPQWYDVRALELLLGSCSSAAAALNSSWLFKRFKDNPNITTIIPCFLRNGLDVDIGSGVLLCFAVQQGNVVLLKRILSANPSITTLRTAFRGTASVSAGNIRFEIMELLLRQAESAEIGQSELLPQVTFSALGGDSAGLKLLLRHRAQVDFSNGSAVKIAALAGSLEVMDLLLLSRPASSSINMTCLAVAFSALASKRKEVVFKRLLAANGGAPAQDMSNLLAESVASIPECTQLPLLLLARGAKPRLETLKVALGECSLDLYVALASNIQSTDTAIEVFRHVRKASIDSNQRYRIYKCLLANDIPSDDVSGALLESLRTGSLENLDLPKLLLQHGAAVGYERAKAFHLALSGTNSAEAFMILSQYIKDDSTAGLAFDLAKKTALHNPYRRVEIYRCLLQWNISESSLYDALVGFLKGGHADSSVVQLLLRKGVDPNKNDAQCFVLACKADKELEFRALSRYANLAMVLRALFAHFREEGQVVRWFSMCLEERPYGAKIDQDKLLFQCMRTFRKGTAVLKLLLDNGVSASAMVTHRIRRNWQPEKCTALIWALFSNRRIGNDAILALLARGRDAGLLHIYLDFLLARIADK